MNELLVLFEASLEFLSIEVKALIKAVKLEKVNIFQLFGSQASKVPARVACMVLMLVVAELALSTREGPLGRLV